MATIAVLLLVLAGSLVFVARGGGKVIWLWAQDPIGVAVPLLAATIVLIAPQMADMFAALNSGPRFLGIDGLYFHEIGLGIGVYFLGWQSWFWMRAAINARKNKLDASVVHSDWQERWTPRLTLVPTGLVAISPIFIYLWGKLEGPERIPLSSVPWLGVVLALLAWVIIWRRAWARRRRLNDKLTDDLKNGLTDEEKNKLRRRLHHRRLFEAAPGGDRGAAKALAAAVAVFVVIQAAPTLVNDWVSTPTAAFMALGSLVALASVFLAAWRDFWRAVLEWLQKRFDRKDDLACPVDALGLISLIALPILISQLAEQVGLYDVHADRGQSEVIAKRPRIADAVATYRACLGDVAENDAPPAIIVALEGGASRSAAWSLSVMRMLDARTGGAFGRHLFAITSVSGGSLAAMTYSLAQAKQFPKSDKAPTAEEQAKFWETASMQNGLVELARGDLLSSSIARMFTSDILFGIPRRGSSLTLAFEQHWGAKDGFALDNTAAARFYGLRDGHPCLPQVLLNGTDVANGGRILTSTLQSDVPSDSSPFSAAIDALGGMKGDVAASDAVLNSARFPFISPPGRLVFGKEASSQVVDGGVFENYGARTAWELADALKASAKVRPIVVIVSNDVDYIATDDTSPGICGVPLPLPDTKDAKKPLPPPPAPRGVDVPELLTSVLGLFNTRQGHALGEIATLKSRLCTPAPAQLFHIGLPMPDIKLSQAAPMNWALDENACRFMLGAARQTPRNRAQATALHDLLVGAAGPDGGDKAADADRCAAR